MYKADTDETRKEEMMKTKNIIKQALAICEAHQYDGICLACGHVQSPDARKNVCEACGEEKVVGAAQNTTRKEEMMKTPSETCLELANSEREIAQEAYRYARDIAEMARRREKHAQYKFEKWRTAVCTLQHLSRYEAEGN